MKLNNQQADLIRLRFWHCNSQGQFCELVRQSPKFAEALNMLPDLSGLNLCNAMLKEMVLGEIEHLFGLREPK